jgi:Ca2+-binding EF-hand superfamily protein
LVGDPKLFQATGVSWIASDLVPRPKREFIMKTISVSLLTLGILLPAVCLAQSEAPPAGPPPAEIRSHRRPPKPFAEIWKLANTDHDDFLSTAEFAAMPRVENLPEEKKAALFKRLDKDTDGKLSRDELSRSSKPQAGPPRQRLWELDTDKSGGVSFEEFKLGPLHAKLAPEKREKVFHRLDTDGDGEITPKDKPLPPRRRPEPKPPAALNLKLDLDGDGALSFEEFRKGPQVKGLTEDEQEQRFQEIDRNGDLKLTPDDFPPPPPPPRPEEE